MLQAVSLLMDKVINNKRGLEIVQNRSSLFKIQNKFRKISLSVKYYLTKIDNKI